MRRVVGALLIVVLGVVHRWTDDPLREAPRKAPSLRVVPPASVSDQRVKRESPSSIPEDYRRDPLAYLSKAPLDSLSLLPGIGPVLAERLASARTGKSLFTRWEDLLAVKGIGPKTVEKLKRAASE